MHVATAALSATLIAGCATSPPVAPLGPTASARTTIVAASPTPVPTSPYGNAELFFEPGPVLWCGVFVSYRPPSATLSGELKIGATTFAASSAGPAPLAQRIGEDVRPGGSACIGGTVVRSETTANLLADFTVTAAPFGAMPHTPIRATPCGAITEVFVTDLPSGGFITLAGTKFLVGGARPSSDAVQLPAPDELRVGVRVCIVGTTLTRVSDAATFEAIGGRVTIRN